MKWIVKFSDDIIFTHYLMSCSFSMTGSCHLWRRCYNYISYLLLHLIFSSVLLPVFFLLLLFQYLCHFYFCDKISFHVKYLVITTVKSLSLTSLQYKINTMSLGLVLTPLIFTYFRFSFKMKHNVIMLWRIDWKDKAKYFKGCCLLRFGLNIMYEKRKAE